MRSLSRTWGEEDNLPSRFARRGVVIVILIGWLLSLALPAITFDVGRNGNIRPFSGWAVLENGWIDTAALQFGWWANPVLLVALAFLWQDRPAPKSRLVLGTLLLLFAADTGDLFIRPDFYTFRGAHAGYWMWVAVCLAAAAANLWVWRMRHWVGTDTSRGGAAAEMLP